MSDEFDFNAIMRDAVSDPIVQKPIKSRKPGSSWSPPSLFEVQAKVAAEEAARQHAKTVFENAQRNAQRMESIAWQNHRRETTLRRARHSQVKSDRGWMIVLPVVFLFSAFFCLLLNWYIP